MPGGDRTGPLGQGPMTGRAAGYCVGNDFPGYAGQGFGRGRGSRGGFGGRSMYNPRGLLRPRFMQTPAFRGAPLSKEEELESLRVQKQNIDKRIDELS